MLTELSRALNNKPTYLFFTITSRCDAFCDFCWNWRNVADAGKFAKPGGPIKRAELSLSEIEAIAKNLPNMLVVNLFGGEPFLRDDIGEIMSLFAVHSRTKYISIPTNGTQTEHILKTTKKFLTDHPDTFLKLYLSIDGPAATHDRVRKLKNGHARAMATAEGLFKLREGFSNLSVACNVNYNNKTQDHVKEFVDVIVAESLFDSISVDMVRGEDLCDPNMLIIDEKRFYEIQASVQHYKPLSGQPFSPLHKAIEQKTAEVIRQAKANPGKRVFNCFAGKKILLLDDVGDVFACEHMLDNKMGNLRDFNFDLEKLLANPVAKKIRQDIVDKKCNCQWECAINTSNIFDPLQYPDLYSIVSIFFMISVIHPTYFEP